MTADRGHEPKDRLLDHEADGIREFDNALPRWWLYGFYFTILFSVAYLINYHVLPRPLVGKGGMVAEYEAEVQAAPVVTARAAATGAMTVLTDPASLAAGKAIFEGPDNACFSCHRADLGGLVGPDLTDDHWLHGCSAAEIAQSIQTGYPLKGMLPYGVGKPLDDAQLQQLVSYVISRRGSAPPDPKPIDPERDKTCQ
jgi:cytochrome c oxidase cbb3-type subunit 3